MVSVFLFPCPSEHGGSSYTVVSVGGVIVLHHRPYTEDHHEVCESFVEIIVINNLILTNSCDYMLYVLFL